MNRRRGWIVIGLGVFFALLAGVLVFYVVDQRSKSATDEARRKFAAENVQIATMKVPVAARQLQAGTPLTSKEYVLQDFPLNLIPPGAITDTVKLDTKVLVTGVGQGETFSTRVLLGGTGAAMSQQVEPGNVLFAFPIVDLLGQSNIVQDGDRLDLLLTIAATGDAKTGGTTAMTLQNITVLKVLRPADADQNKDVKPTALLLSMKPQDAVLVKHIKDSGGVIDFALRSPLDTGDHKSQLIDAAELQTRYFTR